MNEWMNEWKNNMVILLPDNKTYTFILFVMPFVKEYLLANWPSLTEKSHN